MWTEPQRVAGYAAVLALVVPPGCGSPRGAGQEATSTSLVLGVEVQSTARQRVQLAVDDDDRATPALHAKADLPAHSTSTDSVGMLAFLLEEQGCAATREESGDPRDDPKNSEALRLPPGYTVVHLVIDKRVGDGWQPSGPTDLRRLR
jgi:hypothetical protein